MISELFPIIATRDITRSLAFYRDILGGAVSFEYPGPDGKLVYAGVDVGSSHLGIGFSEGLEGRPLPRAIALWIYADDCDATVERLRQASAPILAEPADQPWGERVARVADPDGNEIIVGQRLEKAGGKQVDEDVAELSRDDLIAEVKRLRQGIRTHRDSSGHDLCWHHPDLWSLLPDSQDPLPVVPAWPEFLRGCIRYRQSLDEQLPHAPRAPIPPPD